MCGRIRGDNFIRGIVFFFFFFGNGRNNKYEVYICFKLIFGLFRRSMRENLINESRTGDGKFGREMSNNIEWKGMDSSK